MGNPRGRKKLRNVYQDYVNERFSSKVCIIISRPKNNSPLCDIFLYKSKKFLSQQIYTGTSQQTIPNGTSFIVLSTFFCCAVHNNFSWWHFKNQLTKSLPQFPKELAHSSILLIQNCDEKKNVKAILKKKKKPKKSLPYSTPFFF